MPCIDCPKVDKRHEESIGDLQMVCEVEYFFSLRDMVRLEKTIKIFRKRLLERHNIITGR